MGTSRIGNHPLKMGIPVKPKNQTNQEQQKTKSYTRIAQETTCLCTGYEPAQHKK